jgi:malate dehydrogenase (oxaloacetate-decarboxylating)
MFLAAARAVGGMISADDLQRGRLLPPLSDIRAVSREVAFRVACEAREAGLGLRISDEELRNRVATAMWEPRYLPYRYRENAPVV